MGERGGGRVQLRLHCFLLIFPASITAADKEEDESLLLLLLTRPSCPISSSSDSVLMNYRLDW